jgi:Secretion system C-terminal sorting domain
MKNLLLVVLCVVFTNTSFAQVPGIEWQKSLGGGTVDDAYSICQTFDGGYIVAGYSQSFDGDVTGNHGGFDFWIVKLSSSGAIQWQKSLGGSGLDQAFSVVQTTDSGYIVAGTTASNNGDVTGNHGSYDYWVVKLSSSGSIQWQKCYGGTSNDEANSIQQTTDGGYIIAGYSNSTDGDVTGNHGGVDYWIIKISATGVIEWQKSLGGAGSDFGNKVLQTADGGYVVAGASNSNDGDVTGNHGSFDFWVVKLSTLGVIQWQKSLGGTMADGAADIIQTWDGGYVVAGETSSGDGDVTGSHGGQDYWVVRLSSLGAVLWEKSLGGTGDERPTSVIQSADGGFMVAGYSNSNDGDVTGNKGFADYWLVKLYASGNITWQESLGGSGSDLANCVKQTNDGGYIVAGYSQSSDGDATSNHGNDDYWIVKLKNPAGVTQLTGIQHVSIVPNPTAGLVCIQGASNVNIKAYNTLGQLVKEATNTDHISLVECPAGMYFIRVLNEQGDLLLADKIVKQ